MSIMIFYYMNKSKKDIDYKTIFYLGIIFTLGCFVMFIVTRIPGFLPVMSFGIILKIYCFMNKDKWINKSKFELISN